MKIAKYKLVNSLTPTHTSAFEDGTDRVFRNVGIYIPDAGELP
jgi:hypothetical protein